MKKLLAVSTAAVAVTTGVTATADAATHTVKSGDTLGSISQQYGTSVSAIKAENGLKSNLIFPNQVIKVNEKSSESTTEYTVVAGDTLGKIASKYDVTVSQLKAWNNLSSDLIIVGQTLSLQAPAQSAEPAKAPVAQQAPVQQTQEQVVAPAQQQSYQAPAKSYQAPDQQSYQAPAQQTYKAPAQQSYQAPAQKVRTTQTSTASTGGSTKAQFLAAGGSEAMWNAIVLPESSGNPNAVSPNGYQGLGQTKESWGTGSVSTQTKGMLNYAKSRYGSESAAIAFRQANGWW